MGSPTARRGRSPPSGDGQLLTNVNELRIANPIGCGDSLHSGTIPQSDAKEVLTGLDNVDDDIMVFHAGTKMESGQVLTNGGRVLTVVAMGKTIAEAREKVYANIPRIQFEGCHYRKDIALVKEG